MAVRNHAINSIKKKSIENDCVNDEFVLELTSCDEYEMLAQDVYYHIHNAVKDLPMKAKEVILLSMNDMSISEIEDELNISKNTVKTHRRLAYSKLRESLRRLRE